ncbi:hypothetical protein VTO73DRAFT_11001 [Trametes versicolor]
MRGYRCAASRLGCLHLVDEPSQQRRNIQVVAARSVTIPISRGGSEEGQRYCAAIWYSSMKERAQLDAYRRRPMKESEAQHPDTGE